MSNVPYRSASTRLIAFGLLGLVVAVPFGQLVGAVGYDAALVFSAVSFVGATVFAVMHWRENHRDPYSLATLREYVLEGKIDDDEVPVVHDGGDKYCHRCGEFYDPRLPNCPRCKCC